MLKCVKNIIITSEFNSNKTAILEKNILELNVKNVNSADNLCPFLKT